jgi:tRNA pseudouridine38-40 synthase
MKKISKLFEGKHNFVSFSISDIEDTVRTIKKIKIEKKSNKVYIYVTGNGFLRGMVRMIVGNLLDVSEGKKTQNDIQFLFDNPKKGSSITKAKACGLYLYDVKY